LEEQTTKVAVLEGEEAGAVMRGYTEEALAKHYRKLHLLDGCNDLEHSLRAPPFMGMTSFPTRSATRL